MGERQAFGRKESNLIESLIYGDIYGGRGENTKAKDQNPASEFKEHLLQLSWDEG